MPSFTPLDVIRHRPREYRLPPIGSVLNWYGGSGFHGALWMIVVDYEGNGGRHFSTRYVGPPGEGEYEPGYMWNHLYLSEDPRYVTEEEAQRLVDAGTLTQEEFEFHVAGLNDTDPIDYSFELPPGWEWVNASPITHIGIGDILPATTDSLAHLPEAIDAILEQARRGSHALRPSSPGPHPSLRVYFGLGFDNGETDAEVLLRLFSMTQCMGCDLPFNDSYVQPYTMRDGTDMLLCDGCANSYLCQGCRSVWRPEGHYNGMCRDCHHSRMGEDPRYARRYAVEEDELDVSFRVENYIYRPLSHRRLTSIELEFNAGTDNSTSLCAELHRLGLSNVRRRVGYHSHTEDWCHVENDGSVTGGEMVIRLLNLNTRLGHHILWSALDALRRRVKVGELSLGLNAGCHIHVDVSDLSVNGLVSLGVLMAFLEEPMLHIGSANWATHRAEYGTNRVGWAAVRAANRSAKIGALNESDGRSASSLYMSDAIARRNQCMCDAREDMNAVCNCEALRHSRNTVEFRMFNATTNPRKLDAYIALTQGLVEYAATHDVDPDSFPAFQFMPGARPDAGMAHVYERRLQFILEELPLTEQERNSIRYCIRQSRLSSLSEHVSAERWSLYSEERSTEDRPLENSPDVRHPSGLILPGEYVDRHMRRMVNLQNDAGFRPVLPSLRSVRTRRQDDPVFAQVGGEGQPIYASAEAPFIDLGEVDEDYDQEYDGEDDAPF